MPEGQLAAYGDAISGLLQLAEHWMKTYPDERRSTFILALANQLSQFIAAQIIADEERSRSQTNA